MKIPADSQISQGARVGKDVAIGKNVVIKGDDITIGDNASIGDDVRLIGKIIRIGESSRLEKGAKIRSNEIIIGKETTINRNCDIFVYDRFHIGDLGFLGTASFRGRSIVIGSEFYSSTTYATPLTIGGGGRNDPTAYCEIGDRCTMHNNFINIAKPVKIGNDVGLSPDTLLITHGYWHSVLEGHKSTFEPITIGDNVWIGMRAIVTPGVSIGRDCVIGAGSVVTRDVPEGCIAAGVPARVIRKAPDYPPKITDEERNEIMKGVLAEYATLMEYKGFEVDISESERAMTMSVSRGDLRAVFQYFQGGKDYIPVKGARRILMSFDEIDAPDATFMNLRTSQFRGSHCPITDDLRDYLRRKGIRFYGRKFASIPPMVEEELKRLER
ncbi:MAG: DapH/DapD/GlmU-related protein [Thermoplasmata archaeon]